MHLRFAALVASCVLLGSCAYQGVVVDKSSRELPFSETVGSPGSFAFMLRDASGVVHRQLVTPEVFASYNVGDYFNDLQPPSAHTQQTAEDKVVLTTSNTMPARDRAVARETHAKSPSEIAATPGVKSKNASKLATKSSAKSHKSHRALASHKNASHRKHHNLAKAKAKRHTPAFSTKPDDVGIVDVGEGAAAAHQ